MAIVFAVATSAIAQTSSPPRVIVIGAAAEAVARPLIDSFRQGMRGHGYKEDGNYRLEIRLGQGDPTLVPGLIRDAVASRPAVLVVTGLAGARYARDATSTIPVVVATSSDLVDAGVVKSYARPGGNITGLNDLAASLALALDAAATSRPDALLMGGASLHVARAKEIIERMIAARVPVAHYWPGTAEMGALLSHQADIFYNFRRAAYYVDRILKGAKPGDLAIEQPTRYELVVNRRVARQLNITLPASFWSRADRVIE